MRTNSGEAFRNPAHIAYAIAVYEAGSRACQLSDVVRRHVIGDVPAVQWRVATTPASSAELQAVSRLAGGHPPLTMRPAQMRVAAVVSASAEAIRDAAEPGDKPTIAFRALGNILVVGALDFEPDAAGEYRLAMRYAQDDDRPRWGGLEVAMGNFDAERLQFFALQSGARIVEAQVGLDAFTDRGRYEAVPLR